MSVSSTPRRPGAWSTGRSKLMPTAPLFKGKYLRLTTSSVMAPAWPPRSGS